MLIRTQNKKALINSDFVGQFYIDAPKEDKVKLMAVSAISDDDIVLGVYKTMEHAKQVLEFLGLALINEEAQDKITQIPSREVMENPNADNAPNITEVVRALKEMFS